MLLFSRIFRALFPSTPPQSDPPAWVVAQMSQQGQVLAAVIQAIGRQGPPGTPDHILATMIKLHEGQAQMQTALFAALLNQKPDNAVLLGLLKLHGELLTLVLDRAMPVAPAPSSSSELAELVAMVGMLAGAPRPAPDRPAAAPAAAPTGTVESPTDEDTLRVAQARLEEKRAALGITPPTTEETLARSAAMKARLDAETAGSPVRPRPNPEDEKVLALAARLFSAAGPLGATTAPAPEGTGAASNVRQVANFLMKATAPMTEGEIVTGTGLSWSDADRALMTLGAAVEHMPAPPEVSARDCRCGHTPMTPHEKGAPGCVQRPDRPARYERFRWVGPDPLVQDLSVLGDEIGNMLRGLPASADAAPEPERAIPSKLGEMDGVVATLEALAMTSSGLTFSEVIDGMAKVLSGETAPGPGRRDRLLAVWDGVFVAALARDPHRDDLAYAAANRAVQSLREEQAVRVAAGMPAVDPATFNRRFMAWKETLLPSDRQTSRQTREGAQFGAAWAGLTPEQHAGVDAGLGWPGGSWFDQREREERAAAGMVDLADDTWTNRRSAFAPFVEEAPCGESRGTALAAAWVALTNEERTAVDAGFPWPQAHVSADEGRTA